MDPMKRPYRVIQQDFFESLYFTLFSLIKKEL
jgi:hypothetical protein